LPHHSATQQSGLQPKPPVGLLNEWIGGLPIKVQLL